MKARVSRVQSNSEQTRLKMLSDTEKAQLLELTKTREKILKELGKIPGHKPPSGIMGSIGDPILMSQSLGFTDLGQQYNLLGNSTLVGSSRRTTAGSTAGPHRQQTRSGASSSSGSAMEYSRRQAMVGRHSTEGLSGAAGYINSLKRGMDMMPIMASSGEPAMDAGLRGRGVVRLPVFKLPTLELDKIRAQQRSRQLDAQLQLGSALDGQESLDGDVWNQSMGPGSHAATIKDLEPRFIAFSDLRSLQKALVLMVRALSPAALAFTTYYLDMSEAEIRDIERELKKKADRSAAAAAAAASASSSTPTARQSRNSRSTPRTSMRTPRTPKAPKTPKGPTSAWGADGDDTSSAASGNDRAKEPSIIENFFGMDPDYSVFNLARDFVMDELAHRNTQLSGQSQGQGVNLQTQRALRNIDLSTVGLSQEFSTFLSLDGAAAKQQKMRRQEQHNQHHYRGVGGIGGSNQSIGNDSIDTFESSVHKGGPILGGHGATGDKLPPLRRLGSVPAIYRAGMSSLAYDEGGGGIERMRSNSAQGPGAISSGGGPLAHQDPFGGSLAHQDPFGGSRSRPSVHFHPSISAMSAISGTTGAGAGQPHSLKKSLRHGGHDVHGPPAGSRGSRGQNKDKGTGRGRHSPGSMLRGRGGMSSASGVLDMGNMGSTELTEALLSSLQTMQQHSSMIKKSIADAQSVVSITDPKARSLVFSVAAEKLRRALNPLLLIELRRGFTAWGFAVRQVRRQEKVAVFLRLLKYRNLVLGLHELLGRQLRVKLDAWKHFTQQESQRLLRDRVMRAVVRIQCVSRQRRAHKRVEALRMRRKYQRLYDATIKIQALIRGKVTRWRFLRETRDQIQGAHAVLIQRHYRGYRARRRVRAMRLRHDKAMAAVAIQTLIRGHQAYNRVRRMLEMRRKEHAALNLQAVVRGFVTRRTIATLLINRARFRYAVRIQALVRGVFGRANLQRKVAEIEEYRYLRYKSATQIQALIRGHQARLYVQMLQYKGRKLRDEQFKAATAICTIVRGFNARNLLRDMRQERLDRWVLAAREWQEMWSEESQNWYYFNNATGDAEWEPRREGYTKDDGRLVLASGEVIEDPIKLKEEEEAALARLPFEEGGDGDDEASVRTGGGSKGKKQLSKLCSECMDRVATRACNECGDKYCTKCYKHVHATGSRRNHTYAPLGPIDCQECELRLAERWCVSCDESFCDQCWRKVHGRGKRVYHPYSEISPEGRVDARIFTMDGDQVGDYDASYAQQRADLESFSQQQGEVQQLADSMVVPMQGQEQGQGLDVYGGEYDAFGGEYTGASSAADYDYSGGGGGQDRQALVEYDQSGASDYYSAGYESGAGPGYGAAAGDMVAYDPWAMYYDEQGYPYYYNSETGVSQYESPYE